MERFIARYRPFVTAVLSGFDRLVFRGTLLPLVRDRGMFAFLCRANVRLLDFGNYVRRTSELLKAASLSQAETSERPVIYLESSSTDKETLARRLLAEDPVDSGLVCVFKTVEPCMSFEYHRSPDPQERGLRLRPRKCLHIYHYYVHPWFGFMGARIQTWFPFAIQICLNGREWLAHQMMLRGRTDFQRNDNCFTYFGNPQFAQRLMDQQLRLSWRHSLDRIARQLNPLHESIFQPWPQSYYWSAYQTEWATDLLFRDPKSLAAIYPALVRHATFHFQSPDVMRFLARKAPGNFTGEIVSSFKDRPEGVRVKHWVNGNSIKMYDKAGSVLRVETTIAKPNDFKAFRPPHDDPRGPLQWRPLRKGIADLHRRAQISQGSNERYLDALACVDDSTPLRDILDQVSRHTNYRGRRVRALRIGDLDDVALLRAISNGKFATAGFRNRDIRSILHPKATNQADSRRLSARITRQFRLLRAHGLIRKMPRSHRYRLTQKASLLTAALFAVRDATISQLIGNAA